MDIDRMYGVVQRALPEQSPVGGLDRRSLGPLPVFAQSVAAVAPCGAMATIPAIVLGATGTAAFLAFVCATVVCLLIGWCVRQFACRMRAPGGLYSYSAHGLSPVAALVTGWSAVLGYAAVSMAGLLAVGLYLGDLIVKLGAAPRFGEVIAPVIVVVTGVAVGVLLLRGIRLLARVTLLVETLSIALVLIVLTVLLIRDLPTANLSAGFAWDADIRSLPIGIVVAVSAFVGFESATTLGVEAHRPLASVPRAVRWTVPAAAALYLFSTLVQSVAVPDPAASLGHGGNPVGDLVAGYESTGLSMLLDPAIAASFFCCTLASMNALVRVLFCMGREGVAPRAFGHAHARFRTPAVGLAATMPIVVAVPIVLLAAGARQHALGDLLTLSAFGYLGTYVLICVATPFFLRRIGEATRRAWITSTAAATVIALVIVVGLVQSLGQYPVLASIFIGVVILAVGIALVLRTRAPQRLAAVGLYDETVIGDLARGARRGTIG